MDTGQLSLLSRFLSGLGQGPSVAEERAFYVEARQRKLQRRHGGGEGVGSSARGRLTSLPQPLFQEARGAEIEFDRVGEGRLGDGFRDRREQVEGLAKGAVRMMVMLGQQALQKGLGYPGLSVERVKLPRQSGEGGVVPVAHAVVVLEENHRGEPLGCSGCVATSLPLVEKTANSRPWLWRTSTSFPEYSQGTL